MSLITATNLSKSFEPDEIFMGLSLSIPHRARIAIVGPNGVGKTTLLRILAGEDTPNEGSVQRARNLKMGYLPQEADLQADHSLWAECLSVFQGLIAQEAELASLEAKMGDPALAEEILPRYGQLQEAFDLAGGYTYETRIRQTLTGLGFMPDEHEIPLSHLSGGQRTRALLARLLLSDPELLILDEPTNHLDIAAVEWLEGYLRDWDGAALIVSHDRYFINRVVNMIWEMSPSVLEVYRGNYTAYLMQRQERWDRRQEDFTREIDRMLKELDFVKRFIAGERSQMAKGKLSRLSRQIEAIEKLGLQGIKGKSWSRIASQIKVNRNPMRVAEAEQRLKALRAPYNRPPRLNLDLSSRQRSGNLVLRTYDLEIGYPGTPLFSTQDLELRRLECAALIGPNGSGKTTFLRTILEGLPPLAGETLLGASLKIGYFAQAHEELQPELTLVQEIESVAPKMLVKEIRNYLGRFLFRGDDVYKPVSVLSGGERGRLALAKLALMDSNLLLLDEPTNHLDIPSQEILQDVLSEYEGTIILVSHDRYLIEFLATQIWEIDAQSKTLTIFKGTYSEYKAEQQTQAAQDSGEEEPKTAKSRVPVRNPDRNAEKRRQKRLGELESSIAKLEEQLSAAGKKLEIPPPDPAEVEKLGAEYVRIQTTLEKALTEWEKLHID